jgi:hypothetical protein
MNTTNMPILCIPRVFPNIDEQRIRKIFDELQIGNIQRIDIINKRTEKGEKYNCVFIHFNSWYNNANANQVLDRLLNGKDIKIIYDDPWFWKVSAYRRNPNKINKINNINNNKKDNNKTYNTKPVIIFDEETNKKQELKGTTLPVTVFKPRVLTNNQKKTEKSEKSADNTNSNYKINYGQMPFPLKKHTLPLKIEEEDGEIY